MYRTFMVLFFFLPLLGKAGNFGAFTPQDLVDMLTNQDLHWDASYVGFEPILSPNAAFVCDNIDERGFLNLMSRLDNPDSFAVAHVVLSLSYPRVFGKPLTFEQLLLQIRQKEEVITCEIDDLSRLKKYWEAILEKARKGQPS